eukprot:TRINITY_DN4373_c0_g1_i5.p1 TRINITY_DN4373_c0_g1~~TRINITY_DN4373_c0_g1_i5.p1  ORF type:complete len:257 (-),score=71.68 TRINITY_DN4373_c0_g1_i5:87-857(-)
MNPQEEIAAGQDRAASSDAAEHSLKEEPAKIPEETSVERSVTEDGEIKSQESSDHLRVESSTAAERSSPSSEATKAPEREDNENPKEKPHKKRKKKKSTLEDEFVIIGDPPVENASTTEEEAVENGNSTTSEPEDMLHALNAVTDYKGYYLAIESAFKNDANPVSKMKLATFCVNAALAGTIKEEYHVDYFVKYALARLILALLQRSDIPFESKVHSNEFFSTCLTLIIQEIPHDNNELIISLCKIFTKIGVQALD